MVSSIGMAYNIALQEGLLQKGRLDKGTLKTPATDLYCLGVLCCGFNLLLRYF